jgi:hypothetical protein
MLIDGQLTLLINFLAIDISISSREKIDKIAERKYKQNGYMTITYN